MPVRLTEVTEVAPEAERFKPRRDQRFGSGPRSGPAFGGAAQCVQLAILSWDALDVERITPVP